MQLGGLQRNEALEGGLAGEAKRLGSGKGCKLT